MPEMSLNLAEIEGRIAVLRENIRELVEGECPLLIANIANPRLHVCF
jgi:hypothetical protein